MNFQEEHQNFSQSEIESIKYFKDLISNINKLKEKDFGCPWQKAQTHESLLPFLKEESYEFINAVKNKNYENMEEELGDIFLQIMLHSKIGSEKKIFDLKDVIKSLNNKIKARHPYVFESKRKVTIEEAKNYWDIKKNSTNKLCKKNTFNYLMNQLNKLPSYSGTLKIIKEAEQYGFKWAKLEQILGKLSEEMNELSQAIVLKDKKNIKEELGDIMFTVINLCFFLNLDHEDCLKEANTKFIKRFSFIEEYCGDKIKEKSLQELQEIWQMAKASLKDLENY